MDTAEEQNSRFTLSITRRLRLSRGGREETTPEDDDGRLRLPELLLVTSRGASNTHAITSSNITKLVKCHIANISLLTCFRSEGHCYVLPRRQSVRYWGAGTGAQPTGGPVWSVGLVSGVSLRDSWVPAQGSPYKIKCT